MGKYPTGYSHDYYTEYKKNFDDSIVLYYGTVLFDTSSMCKDSKEVKNYYGLYHEIIGNHGSNILSAIKVWDITHGNKSKHEKEIRILEHHITYQSLFSYDNNIEVLNGLERIISFYQLK